MRTRARERRALDPETNRQKCREWRAQNVEQARARDRARYFANPERRKYHPPKDRDAARMRSRKWKHEHKALVNVDTIRRRATKRNLPSSFSVADWHRCLAYWNDRCAICGRPVGLWHTLAQEHWIPICDPRPDNPGTVVTNILPMCHARRDGDGGCNNSKWRRDPIVWLNEKLGPRKAKRKLAEIETYFAWVSAQE